MADRPTFASLTKHLRPVKSRRASRLAVRPFTHPPLTIERRTFAFSANREQDAVTAVRRDNPKRRDGASTRMRCLFGQGRSGRRSAHRSTSLPRHRANKPMAGTGAASADYFTQGGFSSYRAVFGRILPSRCRITVYVAGGRAEPPGGRGIRRTEERRVKFCQHNGLSRFRHAFLYNR
jgi:hypothetical protein